MTATTRARAAPRKDDMIQIRTSVGTKQLLHRAATLRGQKLSEFMLETARQQAEHTLLDQRLFVVGSQAHTKLLAMLDTPAPPSRALRERMRRTPPWER